MHPDFSPTGYLLASQRNGTLHTGVTSNVLARIRQRRQGLIRGSTREYGVKLLVWFEQHSTMDSAITREKRIKKWNRAWKLDLIEAANPDWRSCRRFRFRSAQLISARLGSRFRGNDEVL